MSKYSHFEMCEKIFGDRYKWDEHKQECTLFTRSDMWDKLVEQQQQIAELQKQLKSQPAEIVEKIRKQIFNHFNVKNIEEYKRLSLLNALFTADAVAEILDTILKEYQK